SLFEKGPSLVNGPPMCHLHAGGNLYREISDHQCVALLKESIDLVRFYPEAVDYRPTVIAVPTDDEGKPEDLYTRLKMLQGEYEALITLDKANKVLGESADYFKLYDRSEVEQLKAKKAVDNPTLMDEWMVPVAKNIDLDKVQFPLIMVQEYGLNAFRLAASVTLRLEAIVNCELHFDHEVVDVKKCEGKEGYLIRSKHQDNEQEQRFDFLINAAGFNSGMIDDFLGFHRERFVEFKAAYVSRWEACTTTWPEMVFYGKRGTPKGMAQFTPYPEGHFQLHGMTKSITLFEEGLVKSSRQSAQPQLHPKLLNKIQKNWTLAESKERSLEAIEHLARFIPAFKQATVVSKPLYGAQQIPGIDETLRAAEVSFADECYARCEIVKASSVLSMADAITKRLIALGFIKKQMYGKRDFSQTKKISETQISDVAHALCEKREYPSSLAKRIKKGR
ncbi:MAG: FAD-dependent oxidoreductase, partial [Thiovulaceae bacterium]|nr:FAD-dependent oxidoreductase [Sulfurimonadaceae bacterium]